MAANPVAGRLMPHQKDEFDVWTCKLCGWKYPNAKPSPKIRKNHKKHCPGVNGPDTHHHQGGSSGDEASDGEHHHGVERANENLIHEDKPSSGAEIRSRDLDLGSLKPAEEREQEEPATDSLSKNLGTPADLTVDRKDGPELGDRASLEGEHAAHGESTNADVPIPLLPHQKDEHDVWICKDCGWRYPNAKPSPKVRRHHKKQCTGQKKSEAGAGGGSSDEHTDDEGLYGHSPLHTASPVEGKRTSDNEIAPATLNPPANENLIHEDRPSSGVEITSRDLDLGSLKPAEEREREEPATDSLSKNLGTPAGLTVDRKDDTEPGDRALLEGEQAPHGKSTNADVPIPLLPHQKDEHDVWICKDCGWRYPNAKPSAKVRKHHKKQCTGQKKSEAGAGGGSSDEHTDDEGLYGHSPLYTASPVEGKRTSDKEIAPATLNSPANEDLIHEDRPSSGAEIRSRDLDLGSLKPAEEREQEEPATDGLSKNLGTPAGLTVDQKDDTEPGDRARPEGEQGAHGESTNADISIPLLPHQKDEHDVWICKDCGWRYPNAKPSPKVRRHHKKQCTGHKKSEAGFGGGSSDEHTDDEGLHGHSPFHTASPVEEKPTSENEISPATLNPPASEDLIHEDRSSSGSEIRSRNLDLGSLQPAEKRDHDQEEQATDGLSKNLGTPAGLTVDRKDDTESGDRALLEGEQAPHGKSINADVPFPLLPHQKDEHDVWICKDCGWRYPNAKPSPKVRKHHKKQCKGQKSEVGAGGGSSDEHTGDEG